MDNAAPFNWPKPTSSASATSCKEFA
jgi:hypothetical protein